MKVNAEDKSRICHRARVEWVVMSCKEHIRYVQLNTESISTT